MLHFVLDGITNGAPQWPTTTCPAGATSLGKTQVFLSYSVFSYSRSVCFYCYDENKLVRVYEAD